MAEEATQAHGAGERTTGAGGDPGARSLTATQHGQQKHEEFHTGLQGTREKLEQETAEILAATAGKTAVTGDEPGTPPAEPAAAEAETPSGEESSETTETKAGEDAAKDEGAGEQKAAKGKGDEPEPDDTKQYRLYLSKSKDALGARAVMLQKIFARDGVSLTLAEALERAKAETAGGADGKPGNDDSAKAGQTAAGAMPATIQATDAKIAELRAAKVKAQTDEVDFKKADELDQQIDALKEHRVDLREQGRLAQTEAQQRYNQTFDAATQRAVATYEFAGQPESEGGKRIAEIDTELKDSGDPLYHDPNKPMILAQMVAKELLIAPRKKEAKAATGKPAAESRKAETAAPAAKKPVMIASGESRTAARAANETDQVSKMIAEARTPRELEMAEKALLARVR